MNTQIDTPLARNVTRLAHLDLPGGGQVCVDGNYAYVGHVGGKNGHDTTILDVADPKHPKVVCTLKQDHPDSHSHKVRVAGDLMIVNVEQNSTGMGRRAEDLHHVRARLQRSSGREPTDGELEQALRLKKGELPLLLKTHKSGYANGGFKIYDISDRAAPRLLAYQKTGGVGVHRFDMDENYAYISTEMEGYLGNILVIYDIRDPRHPPEVSRWWLPGQHIAGGETPTWHERSYRLHHALRRGDRMWAGVWQAGMRVIDVSDITRPRTIGGYNYHPPFKDPTHTFMPLPAPIDGRHIAVTIDEEERYYNAEVSEERRGRMHACISVFDVTDVGNIKPLSLFQVSELDSPWSRTPRGRFGAHQFHEHADGALIYATWFSGGLRIIDLADPSAPREVGHFIPEPVGGNALPQSNDVYVDRRGLIYLLDRNTGFDILENGRT
jgi:hypothetical protein